MKTKATTKNTLKIWMKYPEICIAMRTLNPSTIMICKIFLMPIIQIAIFKIVEFGNVNPDLIDFTVVPNDESHSAPVPTSNVERPLLPNSQFYGICSQLNDMQRHLLNFLMKYVVEC